mmetsp:Transcript_18652/g.33019  ORF Transcript_18652/g.33019 Transcript_18652/m.33019 type:complete len:147 (-) Transcript_18652:98-538(-)
MLPDEGAEHYHNARPLRSWQHIGRKLPAPPYTCQERIGATQPALCPPPPFALPTPRADVRGVLGKTHATQSVFVGGRRLSRRPPTAAVPACGPALSHSGVFVRDAGTARTPHQGLPLRPSEPLGLGPTDGAGTAQGHAARQPFPTP